MPCFRRFDIANLQISCNMSTVPQSDIEAPAGASMSDFGSIIVFFPVIVLTYRLRLCYL